MEHWTQDLNHLDLVLSSLWHRDMCYLGYLRLICGHSLLVSHDLSPLSGAGTKDNLKISQVAHDTLAQREEHYTLIAEVLAHL